jgi:hypothetical protein
LDGFGAAWFWPPVTLLAPPTALALALELAVALLAPPMVVAADIPVALEATVDAVPPTPVLAPPVPVAVVVVATVSTPPTVLVDPPVPPPEVVPGSGTSIASPVEKRINTSSSRPLPITSVTPSVGSTIS